MKTNDWFKDALVYQVYTRSFKDSDGDGIGDIRGIIEKLDYIAALGVDVLWISPFCASPNIDNGYDVSDYRAVMNEAGSMDDLDELIRTWRPEMMLPRAFKDQRKAAPLIPGLAEGMK